MKRISEKKMYATAIANDALIFLCSTFATFATMFDFYFMYNVERASSAPYFFTFTGLSSVYAGVAALIALLVRIITKKRELNTVFYFIKLSSCVVISITFLTTAIYLAPTLASSWWRLYVNSNLINHLIIPILVVVGFIFLETRPNTKYVKVLYTLIPIVIYEVIYLIRAYSHYNPEVVDLYYDIYGLTRFGIIPTIVFVFLFLAVGLGVATGLYFLNKPKK